VVRAVHGAPGPAVRYYESMIRGEKVYLTELDRANAETARVWLNDPDVHEFLLVGRVPITSDQERHYYDVQHNAGDRYNFEIHLIADGTYVGNIGLKDISPTHRRAELGLFIGAKEMWGRGLGGDAIVTCCRFAFLTLGLHSVKIRARADHRRGLELYRRLGFVEVGRDREAVYQSGRFHDYVALDMLESEYRELYGGGE
jgi:RimJ/RimL family protein N-acetyltransferase